MDQDRRQIDRELRQWLWDNYFRIMYMPGDGSCLFHAVAHYCYLHGKKRHQGNKVTHTYLRQICCDYMARHKDQFSSFLTDETSFEEHIEQMRSTTKYADHQRNQIQIVRTNSRHLPHPTLRTNKSLPRLAACIILLPINIVLVLPILIILETVAVAYVISVG